MEWLSISHNGWCACSGEPNSPAPFFILINISISTQQNTHKQQKACFEGKLSTIGCQHISLFGQPLFSEWAVKVTMRTRQIQKFALFRKQRALIILWRTLDNKFAIKMNLNRRERGCFEASLPLLLLLVLSHGAPGLAGLLLSLYACHEAAFGPTRNWQYHASAANSPCSLIVFNEGKKWQSTINELGM